MTDTEWSTSDDPTAMLECVQPVATNRRLRLLACACGRLVWHLLPPGTLREAVEAGERFTDGQIPDSERQAFVHKLYAPWSTGPSTRPATWFGGPPWGEQTSDQFSAFMVAMLAVAPTSMLRKMATGLGWRAAIDMLGPQLPSLLRDTFGLSPRAATSFNPAMATGKSALDKH